MQSRLKQADTPVEFFPWKKFYFIVFISAWLAGFESAAASIPQPSLPGNVTLTWIPSTNPNVTGYNIYYGTTSGNYTKKIIAGNTTSVTISNLNCGSTYYFAATAYDNQEDESGFSNETQYIVPGVLNLCSGQSPGDPPMIKFPVAPTHWYEVQAAQDLKSWTTIWQTGVATSNAWVQFSDPDAGSYKMRFYRLVLH
jgi:Fibronectin type III domain